MSKEHLSSRLRHRVTLQEPALTTDNAGGYTRTWDDVADLWAEVSPLEAQSFSQERLQDLHLQSRVTHRVTLRYREGVTADMRLVFEERVLVIRAIVNARELGEALVILAEEGAEA